MNWTNRVRNEGVIRGVKEKRSTLHTIKRRKVTWTGHVLHRNCPENTLLKERYWEGWKGREDEEEDVSSYWVTLRKSVGTGN
jgi:hypothetical protein